MGSFLMAFESDDEDSDDEFLQNPLASSFTPHSTRLKGRRSCDLERVEEEGDEEGNGIAGTILAFMKAFIGTAILFIPNGFRSGGVLGAICVLTLAGSLTTFCINRLLLTKEHLGVVHGRPVVGYGDIAFLAVGPKGKTAVDIATLLSQVGFGCVYFVFIAQNMVTICDFGVANDHGQQIWMLICVFIFVPLVWVRRLSYYTTTNALSFVAIIFSLLLITGVDGYSIANGGLAKHIKWGLGEGFISFFGTSIYAFEGVAMVPFIQEDMKPSLKGQFRTLMFSCMLFIVLSIMFIGGFSYISFGDKTAGIVLQNLDSVSDTHAWHSVVTAELVLYCLIGVCTFPILMVPPIKITERRMFQDAKGVPLERKSGFKWQKNLFRLFAVLVCAVISVLTTSALDHFVSIVGALACVPLALTFPAYFHLQTIGQEDGQACARAVDWAIIVFGCLGSVVAFVSAVMDWAGHPIKLPV